MFLSFPVFCPYYFFTVVVFFSMPVGAELPIYYAHKQGMNRNMLCDLSNAS